VSALNKIKVIVEKLPLGKRQGCLGTPSKATIFQKLAMVRYSPWRAAPQQKIDKP
jgi:hypothetical protein